MNDPDRLVGMEEIFSSMEEKARRGLLYRRTALQLPHYVIRLEEGNGRRSLTNSMAAYFRSHNLRRFGGLDLALYFKLDGSAAQLRDMMAAIHTSAIYTNCFEGLIALDVSAMENRLEDKELLEELKTDLTELAASATLLLFLPDRTTPALVSLMDQLLPCLQGNLEVFRLPPYTPAQLVEIEKQILIHAGARPEEDLDLNQALLQLIRQEHVCTAADAKILSRKLLSCADASASVPVIRAAQLKSLLQKGGNHLEK